MIEGLSLTTMEYPLGDGAGAGGREAALQALQGIDGVEEAHIAGGAISVRFYPEMVSGESIRRELVTLGVAGSEAKKPRNPFRRFVDRLAETNAKSFGAQPLDCCKLNRNGTPGA